MQREGDELRELLRATGLEVDAASAGELEVARGKGRQRRAATVVAAPADAGLIERPGRSALAAFARGVSAALSEPPRTRDRTYGFREAAGRIVATVEGPGFVAGATHVGAPPPFMIDFVGELRLAFHIELDLGYRLVTEEQVDTWGAHPDRVEKAAVSLLFHKTGGRKPIPEKDAALPLERYALGDGFDPARAFILDMLDYFRCRAGLLFAMPSPDVLLLLDDDGSSERREAFSRLIADRFHDAAIPLSPHAFAYLDGRRVDEPIGTSTAA